MDLTACPITRRTFFKAGAAAALPVAVAATAAEDGATPLWPGQPPGGGGPKGSLAVDRNGALSNVATPTLQAFLPAMPTGAAVLIAAGGGYRRIEMATEALPAAQWLCKRGIAAFVLTYRLPGEAWNGGAAVALQDAQRALRMIRAGAARYRLDADRIGVLGFSAGAHLLGLAATRADFAAYEAADDTDKLSARPDSCALIYPVITLMAPYDRTSTRRALLGAHPDSRLSAEWSVQTHLRRDDPAMFLVQADDDPVSNPANVQIMAAACERAGVAVDLHRLASGGHGFGMGRAGTPAAVWPTFYESWLRGRRFLT